MHTNTLWNHIALQCQIARQKRYAWDLERDFHWERGIDLSRPFLPLDEDCLFFPGCSSEQRLALSQLAGLLVNATICETESVINKVKGTAWETLLKSYPVNPELYELGELFFIEENKHARAFEKYQELFCLETAIEPALLTRILPSGFGSNFLGAITKNSLSGGHAFWWVVATVEEASVDIFQKMRPHRSQLDPLFFQLHQRHFEEELRHANYAFFMLSLIETRSKTLRRLWHQKTDLLLAQLHTTRWVIGELQKVFRVKQFKDRHPFFQTIASCLPHLEYLSPRNLAARLFVSAPYISLLLNSKNHPYTTQMSDKHGAFGLPLPSPEHPPLYG